MSKRPILIVLVCIIPVLHPASPAEAEPRATNTRGSDLASTRIEHRIVKSFDFDERPLGNFEPEPMNWLRMIKTGYPRFLKAGFDERIGHTASPSFRLDLQGGSIGYYYRAKDIPVDPDSDYRMTAWIRPRELKHAGARVSVYYLDHALRKIPESEQTSNIVRGAGDEMPWARVEIDLPGGYKRARWIGLSCQVCQPPKPPEGTARFHPIHYHDVEGSAWFDDIRIIRLPHVGMTLNAPNHIAGPDQSIVCRISLKDRDGNGLEADLDLIDAEGTTLQTWNLHGADLVRGSVPIDLGELAAGLYRIRLTTRVDEFPISTHERTFLRLNPDPSAPKSNPTTAKQPTGRGFGVIAEASLFDHPKRSLQLLKHLSPEVVKVPIWLRDMSDEAIVAGDRRVDQLVDTLQRDQRRVVGVLESPPVSLASQYKRTERSLWSILASDPNQWRPYLALILTRHGHRIHAWQIGAEEGPGPDDRSLLQKALAGVRAEMQPLIGRPELVLPIEGHHRVDAKYLPADVLSILLPSQFSADRLADQLGEVSDPTFTERWVTVESPASDRYQRRWRLIEFAQRLITARSAGVDTVFVRQPWRYDAINGDVVVTPAEEFILFRTLCQMLGGLTPVRPVWLGAGVTGWLYSGGDDGRGALVVRTTAASEVDRRLMIDLNQDARQIDLWGNVREGNPVRDGLEYPINAMPTIISPVDPRRIEMLADFAIDNAVFQPTVANHKRSLTIRNTRIKKLIGRLQLETPPGWRIRPRRWVVNLAPGESKQFPFQIRMPTNQAAGDYELLGRLKTDEGNISELTLRTAMRVSAPGLDVNVAAFREGGGVRVVQRVTNVSDDAMRLRAYVLAPEQARDQRLIPHLAAGQTAVRQYTIEDASRLVGRPLRVTVEQIDGPLRHNTLVNFE
ncbi:MAG: NEW3 domain-containing protein [Phycisphaerae bacterium]